MPIARTTVHDHPSPFITLADKSTPTYGSKVLYFGAESAHYSCGFCFLRRYGALRLDSYTVVLVDQ